MTNDAASEPARLTAIVDEFADFEPRERLEALVEFADQMAPLPAELAEKRDAEAHRVHECQTPVFLWVEVRDGRVMIFADVAPEAPTVKGFLALLIDALSGASPAEVAAVHDDLLQRLGLVDVLGMMRMRGLHAVLYYIRKQAAAAPAEH
ncbi:MAG: SufE family protein [Pirellulales bacterium]|nr:SufE family protein [Pirellulales bacterium]